MPPDVDPVQPPKKVRMKNITTGNAPPLHIIGCGKAGGRYDGYDIERRVAQRGLQRHNVVKGQPDCHHEDRDSKGQQKCPDLAVPENDACIPVDFADI